MALCVAVNKTGPVSLFSNQQPVKDVGSFTVPQTDVPLAARRLLARPKAGAGKRRNARLTPISEGEETEFDFMFEAVSEQYPTLADDAEDQCRSEGTSSRLGFRSDDELPERSDTPTVMSGAFRLSRELATLSEEVIGDQDEDVKSGKVVMPKLKFKRKAVPLMAKSEQKIAKPKKQKQHLTPRPKVLNEEAKQRLIEQETKARLQICEMAHLAKCVPRPKSAEASPNVIRLPSLSNSHSFSSVPSLPEALNKLSKSGFTREDVLTTRTRRNSFNKENTESDSYTVQDVSRMSVSPIPTSPADTDTDTDKQDRETSLKGSNMSLFYNMWDWKKSRRPFDKKTSDKEGGSLIRKGCHCLKKIHNHVHHSPRKAHNGVSLPPL